jgi:hypothetical protein
MNAAGSFEQITGADGLASVDRQKKETVNRNDLITLKIIKNI